MSYPLVKGCCPAPAKLAPDLQALAQEVGCVYNSVYRGTDAESELHHCGKHTQAELYRGWLERRPGFNPANPPGFSTHELRNDGVAYARPRGARLPWWCCGIDIDVNHVPQFLRAARKRGWVATLTYPGSVAEAHHVNFRRAPFMRMRLKRGARGWRVNRVNRWLARLGYPHEGRHPHHFTSRTEEGVEEFQRAHHLAEDGTVGKHTWHQLKVCIRQIKRKPHG